MKRWVTVFLVLCMAADTVFISAKQPETVATTAVTALNLSAKSAVVMESGSKALIYEKNKDRKLPPASVTKIMSLLLIFEELDKGNLKLSDQVTISDHAASMGGSQVFLEPMEVQTVETLVKCVVISSANDAVVALAEHLAGSEEAFVKKMNQKAKEIGMNHTVFKNACGLDEEGHLTTAYDIALMSRELTVKHPAIFKYTKIWMDSFEHRTKKGTKEFGLSNTNRLLRQYNGCTGLKTGSTGAAKFCLSATATRNGVHMIAVVMACSDSKTRSKDAGRLLDYGFASCKTINDVSTSGEIGKIPLQKGKKEYVIYPGKIKTKITIVKNQAEKIKKEIKIYPVEAPVKKGQTVGMIHYKINGKTIQTAPIRALQSIGKMDYKTGLWKLLREYF